jgi:hypothetical protein
MAIIKNVYRSKRGISLLSELDAFKIKVYEEIAKAVANNLPAPIMPSFDPKKPSIVDALRIHLDMGKHELISDRTKAAIKACFHHVGLAPDAHGNYRPFTFSNSTGMRSQHHALAKFVEVHSIQEENGLKFAALKLGLDPLDPADWGDDDAVLEEQDDGEVEYLTEEIVDGDNEDVEADLMLEDKTAADKTAEGGEKDVQGGAGNKRMSGGGHSPVSKAQKPASKGKKRAMSPASVTADRVVKSKSYSHKNHLGQTVSLKHHLGQTVLLNEAGDGLERGPVCVLRDPTHHAFQDSSVGSATMRESRSEKSVQDEEILRQAKRTHVVMLQQQEADADLMISQMLI